MRERVIENNIRRVVEKRGGKALKFIAPGWSGAPDRLVLMPGGMAFFVEAKRPGEAPRPLQVRRHRELEALGYGVRVIDTLEGVTAFAAELDRLCTSHPIRTSATP